MLGHTGKIVVLKTLALNGFRFVLPVIFSQIWDCISVSNSESEFSIALKKVC